MKRILILSVIFLGILALSCERSKDPEGPSLNDLYGPFKVLDGQEFKASNQNVDFSNGGTIHFTCGFSKQVEWTVTIRGVNSGATKVIEGFTAIIGEENSRWFGDITSLPMVKVEPCEVILTVETLDTNYADTIGINVRGVRPIDGHLVTDFENGLNPGFTVFIQSGVPPMIFDTVVDPTSAEGNVCYEMSGEVPFADDLGNILMPVSSFTDTNFTLPENEEIVYFNFFGRKGPQVVNEIFVFQFMEDDDGNGSYNAGGDDLYEYVVGGPNPGMSEEWGHFSIKYSDLVGASLNGNQEFDPDRLVQMRLLPISPPPDRLRIQTFVDYMIFTENAPLKP